MYSSFVAEAHRSYSRRDAALGRFATEGLSVVLTIQDPPFAVRAAWKCLASTPAFARCPQFIFGPCGPYTFTNCAFVGRPARAESRVPSAMCSRAALDLTCVRFGVASFLALVAFFLVFIVASLPGLSLTIS